MGGDTTTKAPLRGGLSDEGRAPKGVVGGGKEEVKGGGGGRTNNICGRYNRST